MNKILIIHFNRLGDIAQTLPMVSALSEKYGVDAEISFLTDFAWKDIVSMHPDIKTVHCISASKYDVAGDYSHALSALIEMLKNEKYECVINLEHSKSGMTIAAKLNVGNLLGPYLGKEGQILIDDKWSRYFYAMIKVRQQNPLNIVDLYSSIAGCEKKRKVTRLNIPDNYSQDAKKILSDHGISEKKRSKYIIIHVGASEAKKQWGSQNYITLGRYVLENTSVHLVFTGVGSERTICDECCDILGARAINLAGKTKLGVLTAIISDATMFVGNDTGPSHIAALLDIPVVLLTSVLAHAHPMEIGPYNNKSIVVYYSSDTVLGGVDIVAKIMLSYLQHEEHDFGKIKEDIFQMQLQMQSNLKIFYPEEKQNMLFYRDISYVNHGVSQEQLLRDCYANLLCYAGFDVNCSGQLAGAMEMFLCDIELLKECFDQGYERVLQYQKTSNSDIIKQLDDIDMRIMTSMESSAGLLQRQYLVEYKLLPKKDLSELINESGILYKKYSDLCEKFIEILKNAMADNKEKCIC